MPAPTEVVKARIIVRGQMRARFYQLDELRFLSVLAANQHFGNQFLTQRALFGEMIVVRPHAVFNLSIDIDRAGIYNVNNLDR